MKAEVSDSSRAKEREVQLTEPASADLGHLVHRRSRLVLSVIPLNDSEDRLLVAISNRGLVHDSAHDFRVLNDEVAIVGAHIEGLSRPGLLVRLVLALEVDEDLGLLVGAHEDVEDLLAGPEANGLDDGGRRDVDLEVGVGEVSADLGELGAVEKGVAAGDEVATGDEVLGSGDDGLSITRRDEVALDVHELEGLGPRLLGLRHVCEAKERLAAEQEREASNRLRTQVHFVSVEIGVVPVQSSMISESEEGEATRELTACTHTRSSGTSSMAEP